MATRTSSRKQRRTNMCRKPQRRTGHLELLLTAALALSGLAISTEALAQSAADETTLSLGYLDYQDHQHGGKGIQVQSPTLYFKTPLGPRTEIEGGFVYDSISGASAFNLAPRQLTNVSTVPPLSSNVSPPCRVVNPIQAVSRASGGSSSTPAPKPSSPKPSHSSGSSSGGSSSGGSSLPICGAAVSSPVTTSSSGSSSSGGSSGSSKPSYEKENDNENEGGHGGENDRKLYQLASKAEPFSGNNYANFTDERIAGDIKVTHYLDSFSIGTGIAYSTENDYDSLSLSADTRIWTPDKNTTFALGVSGSFDTISSSADPTLSENKNSQEFLLGVTQVFSPIAIMQSNITFANHQGYLTDVYLDGDKRPSSRQSFAWLTRYNLYIEPADAALHLDYRLYNDSWGVLSHMVEFSWYQPVLSGLMLRPSLRYYSQSSANFYSYDGTPVDNQENFTVDQRLSSFGGVTVGLKLIADLGAGFSGSIGYDYLTQSSGLQFGSSKSSTSRDPLDAQFVFIELTKKF